MYYFLRFDALSIFDIKCIFALKTADKSVIYFTVWDYFLDWDFLTSIGKTIGVVKFHTFSTNRLLRRRYSSNTLRISVIYTLGFFEIESYIGITNQAVGAT